MAGSSFQLTPEQLALSRDRKLKKQQKHVTVKDNEPGPILGRQWLQLEPARRTDGLQRLKILNWNVRFLSVLLYVVIETQTIIQLLAQCLVRKCLGYHVKALPYFKSQVVNSSQRAIV